MKKMMYSVRDDLAEVFQDCFASINDSTAKRDFINGVSGKMIKNDLTLYCVGEFNDATGLFTPLMAPRRMLSGMEILEDQQPLDYDASQNANTEAAA